MPWGRPPVRTIPVPPFGDRRSAGDFVTHLAHYAASLATDGPVDLMTFAVATVLQAEIRRTEHEPHDPWPRPTVLRLAVSTYFPAPWTPRGLHDTIGRVCRPAQGEPTGSASDSSFWWSVDPAFHANRGGDGGWTITRTERGTSEVWARTDTDDDMVLWRMGHERANPFPFGWVYDESLIPPLDAAASAARRAWGRHAELPYLTAWDEERRRSR